MRREREEQPYVRDYSFRMRRPPLLTSLSSSSSSSSSSRNHRKSSFPSLLPEYLNTGFGSGMGSSSSSVQSLALTESIVGDHLFPVFQPISSSIPAAVLLPNPGFFLTPPSLRSKNAAVGRREQKPVTRKQHTSYFWNQQNSGSSTRRLGQETGYRSSRGSGTGTTIDGDWFEARIPLHPSPSNTRFQSASSSPSSSYRNFPPLQLNVQRYRHQNQQPYHHRPQTASSQQPVHHSFTRNNNNNSYKRNQRYPPEPDTSHIPAPVDDEPPSQPQPDKASAEHTYDEVREEGGIESSPDSPDSSNDIPIPTVPRSTHRDSDSDHTMPPPPSSWSSYGGNVKGHFVTEIPTRPNDRSRESSDQYSWSRGQQSAGSRAPEPTAQRSRHTIISDLPRTVRDNKVHYSDYSSQRSSIPFHQEERMTRGQGPRSTMSWMTRSSPDRESVEKENVHQYESNERSPQSDTQREAVEVRPQDTVSPDSSSGRRKDASYHTQQSPSGRRAASLEIYHQQSTDGQIEQPPSHRSSSTSGSPADADQKISSWDDKSPGNNAPPAVKSIQDILNVVRNDEKH